jgi:O-antigen/teichoic acid export membrane protein
MGHGWAALVQLLVVPILLRRLGVESYGLLGFYVALQGVAQVLDLGLSPTMSREMARASVSRDGRANDLLLTVEVGYWAVGIVLGLALAFSAPVLATHWLSTSLSQVVVQQDLLLMGALLTLQWPLSLYEGAFIGLQRMLPYHVIGMTARTVGTVGGALSLYVFEPSLSLYLMWQIGATLAQAATLAILVRRYVPRIDRPARFSKDAVRTVWRFAAGMSGLALTGILIANADKLVLSRFMSLEDFGYYAVAALLGGALFVLVLPTFHVVFPMLCARVQSNDERGERDAYHLAAQVFTVVVVPAAAVGAFFASDLLLVWTRNADVARRVAPAASLLLAGTALNGLMNPAYALQLAHGWTRLGLWLNVALLVLMVPLFGVVAPRYGAVGAAAIWAGLNAAYLLTGMPLTHRRLLRGSGRRWLTEDVGLPATIAVGVAAVGQFVASRLGLSAGSAVAFAVVVLALAYAAAAYAAPRARHWAFARTRIEPSPAPAEAR